MNAKCWRGDMGCQEKATHRLLAGPFSCEIHGQPKNHRSVAILLINPGGRVLSITRGDNLEDWGLIGGKVDPEDETDTHAAFREAKEEAGAVMEFETIIPIYGRTDKAKAADGSDFLATVFTGIIRGWTNRTHGHEGQLAWKKPADLIVPA